MAAIAMVDRSWAALASSNRTLATMTTRDPGRGDRYTYRHAVATAAYAANPARRYGMADGHRFASPSPENGAGLGGPGGGGLEAVPW